MARFELLSKSRLFSECTERELLQLCEIAQDRELADGERIFSHGEEAHDLMIVASGNILLELPIVILEEKKNIAFDTKRPGDVVGWSALVPPYRSTLSGRAKGGASIVAFPRSDLIALFEADPAFAFRVMRNLATIVSQRLQHTQMMWVREIQRSLDERYR